MPTHLCYPVLSPFKFGGVVVKPPVFIQMDAAQARPYQDAAVLGDEDMAALPPQPETDVDAQAEAEAATLAQTETSATAKPPTTAKKAATRKAAK